MGNILEKYKPAATKRTLLFFSALLWTIIGLVLITRGFNQFVLVDTSQHASWLYLCFAVFAGSLKSILILDVAARRAIRRILTLQDGSCLGAVYSWKTWLLVVAMMGSGILLRSITQDATVLCFVYIAVGWSLLLSSRQAWINWFNDDS